MARATSAASSSGRLPTAPFYTAAPAAVPWHAAAFTRRCTSCSPAGRRSRSTARPSTRPPAASSTSTIPPSPATRGPRRPGRRCSRSALRGARPTRCRPGRPGSRRTATRTRETSRRWWRSSRRGSDATASIRRCCTTSPAPRRWPGEPTTRWLTCAARSSCGRTSRGMRRRTRTSRPCAGERASRRVVPAQASAHASHAPARPGARAAQPPGVMRYESKTASSWRSAESSERRPFVSPSSAVYQLRAMPSSTVPP